MCEGMISFLSLNYSASLCAAVSSAYDLPLAAFDSISIG
jgi:hypothetical protein